MYTFALYCVCLIIEGALPGNNRSYNWSHFNDVIMGAIASQITSVTIVYSIVYSDADQRKHQSSASLAFVRGIHRGPVSSPHNWPVTRIMFPFDDVIMRTEINYVSIMHATDSTKFAVYSSNFCFLKLLLLTSIFDQVEMASSIFGKISPFGDGK